MDDEWLFNEKQSIRESARSLKKYGSTCNHVRNNEILIRHELQKTDTLQGIALKYGCTTEQIRRANRLFAQDSLFLRQFLMIPVEKDSPYYQSKLDERPQSLTSTKKSSMINESVCNHSTHSGTTSTNNNINNNNHIISGNSKSMDSMVVMSPEEENKKDIDAFLGKIDLNLAESRKFVAKSQKSLDYMSNSPSSDLYGYPSTSSTSSSSLSQHVRNNSTGFSSNDTIQLLGMTQSRRVQNSLLRLEKQQDEFFEL